jgi:nicotinate-nucleotide--dimethylbenzimidazole phosphoribosyltransferase
VARPAAVLLFAADHPVVRHGVAAYPASVTAGMVANFAAGGAAASVAAVGVHGLPLEVHDVGVDTPYDLPPAGPNGARVVRHACAERAAGDLREQDAMDPDLFAAALEAGRSAVLALDPTPRVLILGEMGIGNTTPASAVAAALLGRPAADLAGPGTGLDSDGVAAKAAVIDDALRRIAGTAEPLEILRRVGGRELAAIAGAALAARGIGALVLVDGFIVTAAILAAVRSEPELREHLLFAHRSGEPGHALLLEELDASPLLDLGLRLGEGSGALAAFGLVDLACRLHGEMATFADAGLEGGPA